MTDRILRISEEIRKELSNIIQSELKDPRLPKMISVVSLNVTKDLKHAKVYVSVLGNDEDRNNALQALKSAAGFLRREIGHRVQIRSTPELHFEIDQSIERGIYLTKLINDTVKHDTEISNEAKNEDV